MRRILKFAWLIAAGASLLSLLFFRSSAGHGPDNVGQELMGFISPLLVAFVASLGLAFLEAKDAEDAGVLGFKDWQVVCGTIGVGAVEGIVYALWIM